MIFNHYLGGGAYPVGGSARIAETVAAVIADAGGELVVGAEVAVVTVAGGRASGVRLKDGREIPAPLVISDVGVPNTALKLLREGTPGRRELCAALERTPRSASELDSGPIGGVQQDPALESHGQLAGHQIAKRCGSAGRPLGHPNRLVVGESLNFCRCDP